jgi:hypothetical protein
MLVTREELVSLKLLVWLVNTEWNILKFGKLNNNVSSIGDTSIAPVFDYLFSTIIT